MGPVDFKFAEVPGADVVVITDRRTGREVQAWGRGAMSGRHPFAPAKLVRNVFLDVGTDGELAEAITAVRALRGEPDPAQS